MNKKPYLFVYIMLGLFACQSVNASPTAPSKGSTHQQVALTTFIPTLGSTPSYTVTEDAGMDKATLVSVTPDLSWIKPCEAGTKIVSPVDGMEMVCIPEGNFIMGFDGSVSYPDERPAHQVYLEPYWMDVTEVTNDMFARFVEDTRYQTSAEKEGGAVYVEAGTTGHYEPKLVKDANWMRPRGALSNIEGMGNHPVVQVSWFDAKEYCRWAGRRLPSEEEWEKAGRGTDGRLYPWGVGDPTDKLANIQIVVSTTPVGAFPKGASPFGILDMVGNAWEWTSSNYSFYKNGPLDSPNYKTQIPPITRIVKGTSFKTPLEMRLSLRAQEYQGGGNSLLGFRCAMNSVVR